MVLIIPKCFIVAIKGISGGQEIVNVIGVRDENAGAASIANAVLAAWKVANGPLFRLPTTYQMLEVKAMDIRSADGQVFTAPDTSQAPGAGALATNGSCALITFGNGSRQKSTRGRMYFGPLRENDINADGRTLTTPSNFTSALTNFKTALETPGREWVILSRKNSSASPVQVIQTQTVIATQRRRIR